MKICVIYPPSRGIHTGNHESANQWAAELEAMGHQVRVAENEVTACCDAVVVLHGIRGREAVAKFKARRPEGPVVVVLTGTDLYGDGGPELRDTMRAADRLVVLQSKALERVPEEFRGKTRVILQGAEPMVGPLREKRTDPFQVCVVGHLRGVKDPMQAALASRLLPAGSRLVVKHAGAIAEEGFRPVVEEEQRVNPRYTWMGELPNDEVRRLMAESQAMVISSRQEGGARVVGESIVEGTPVIAARSEGVQGLLGDGYEGYFEPGATAALAELLRRAESEDGFLDRLTAHCERLAPQWAPSREVAEWQKLIRELEEA
ncbi:MAG: TIGR04348 family glycosyltransferase [Akkermansiaceae bacterium]|nr:TIGR04348 family glycosyltransferase [Akkermansiaceae bacterium]